MKLFSFRTIKTIYLKLLRQKGTPESIARGVASGFFIGFLIPIGFQTGLAIGLAFLLKAKKIPAAAATWITNPVTVTFIYPVQCYVGARLLGQKLTFDSIDEMISSFMEAPSVSSFVALGGNVILIFILGGLLFGIVSGVISYFATLGMVESYRRRKHIRLNKKLASQASK
jgi:uncharacterized protein (DUF2062 family)